MAEIQLRMFLSFVMLSAASHILLVNAEDGGDHGESPFRITRVTKTEGRTAYVVTAQYEADVKPTVFLIARGILTQVTHGHDQLGVVEVRIPKARDDPRGYDALGFLCPNIGLVEVRLNLIGSSTTMELPPIHLHVQQGRDITFQPGSDIELDISLTVDGDITNDDLFASVLVKSEDKDNEVQHYHFLPERETPVTFELLRGGGTLGNRSATFRLNPSGVKQDVEGILEVFVEIRFDCSSNCFVDSVKMPLYVKFYRQDHTGPFPSGFIGFVRNDLTTGNSSQIYCSNSFLLTNRPCVVYCEVVGDHPQAIQLTKVGSDHNSSQGHADAVTVITDYTAGAYIYDNQPDALPSQSDFRCTARSSTREITKMLTVNFVIFPSIDRELSGITKFENGSLKATCEATGRPAPAVSLFPDGSDAGYPDSYELTTTHVNVWTTRAELFIPEGGDTFTFIECSASNNPETGDRYSMYVAGSLPKRIEYYLLNYVVNETSGAQINK